MNYLQSLLNYFGFQLRRHPGYLDQCRVRKLILKNFDINYVIDGGANEGQYGGELRKNGYAKKIMSFEPVKDIYDNLKLTIGNDDQWKCFNLGLGDLNSKLEINIAGKMSSIFERSLCNDSHEFNLDGKEIVEIVELDDFMDSSIPAKGARILLKLDLQGYELAALKGAVESLKRIVVVEVEMSLWPIYEASPTYQEIISFMLDRGFVLWAIFPHGPHPVTGRISEVDAFFVQGSQI